MEVCFMKVTILGNSGGFPAAGGATSGYLLDIDGHYVLLDCGSGVLANLFKLIDITKLDALILTHLHNDHISGVDVLKYAIDLSGKYGMKRTEPLPVFAPETPEAAADNLRSEGNLIIARLKDGMTMNLYGARLETFRMEHPVETYGLRIVHNEAVFAFTADSIPCDALDDLLHDADLAIMDAGTLEKYRKPVMMHMTAAECAAAATRNNVRKLLLTHILPLIDGKELLVEAQKVRAQTELAELMQTYEVGNQK
jgi:ribonuclease BN (tRNA processing enzyme)